MSLIVVRDLRKTYRVRPATQGFLQGLASVIGSATTEVRAVDGVSFVVEPGECVGYLGPNGAGKSTTIKLLTGILVPTGGHATVAGLIPWRARMQNARQIGVVFGQRTQLYWDLPLIHSFEMHRHIYGISKARYDSTLGDFRRLLGLEEFIRTPVRQLSLGQRMRGDLVAAMLHDPKILYLDEPTIGLDLVAKDQILEFIATINRVKGVTVLLTTHNLAEVERLCRRIILIHQGRILHDGDLEAFKRKHAPFRTLVVHLARPAPPVIRPLPGAEITVVASDRLEVRFPRGASPQHLIRELAGTFEVKDLAIEEPSLEGVLRELYREPPAEVASR